MSVQIDVWRALQQSAGQLNDVLTKIRTLAFLYLGAAASAVVAFYHADGPGRLVHSAYLLCALLVPWFLFYLLDRFYYHVLLQGTLQVARRIERRNPLIFGTVGPSQLLSAYNRWFRFPIPRFHVRSGGQKISFLYATPAALIGLVVAGAISFEHVPRELLAATGYFSAGLNLKIISGAMAAGTFFSVIEIFLAIEEWAIRKERDVPMEWGFAVSVKPKPSWFRQFLFVTKVAGSALMLLLVIVLETWHQFRN